ncbi:hypothetical protein LOAG_04572 [Loa loa]|uniref:Translin-associated protein X n=1 Tax=Loa loa TaxID=7209 RepID=A0A1I7W079_LOALO|nr:hypothetical protein LOAG_04572 [Loa loa]EFO23912.1 hypothetical protein LOAG_04572 [Loa loa]
MSEAQAGSTKSHDRGCRHSKRRHDSSINDNDDVGSSRYQRIVTEEDRKDFVSYQKEMDERRDRYERIVKLSRDVIIECKRIIFQLHRIVVVDTAKDREELLKEANKRLNEVSSKMLQRMAKELYNLDQYYYIKSFDWALEEYIEALAFYKFLISGEVLLYGEVIDALQFVDAESGESKKLYVELPEVTYLMGVFDVGGELMRLAISEISSGNSDIAVSIVNYMRLLHGCYELLGNIMHTADWAKKSQVFRECLMKVENALYKWKIRENDIPAESANISAII